MVCSSKTGDHVARLICFSMLHSSAWAFCLLVRALAGGISYLTNLTVEHVAGIDFVITTNVMLEQRCIMARVYSSLLVKFSMNLLKIVSIADRPARLGWIQAHGFQVTGTKIIDDMERFIKMIGCARKELIMRQVQECRVPKANKASLPSEKLLMASEKLLCHQCRRYKVNFFYCTNRRNDGDLCNFKYCEGCILSRYGKKEAEVARLDNWVCPKCREECECSVCRKSRGLPPLGILTSTEQEKYIKMIDCTRKYLKRLQAQECRLPKATIPITKVAGIEMNTENVGPALQFLEYCRASFPVLYIGDGDAERILEEIAQGRDRSSVQP